MNEFLELRNEALQLGLSYGTKGTFRFPCPLTYGLLFVKEVNCMTGDIICNHATIEGGCEDLPITRMVYNKILELLKS